MQVDYLHVYVKCHSSKGVFQTYFASKSQLPGLTVSGTLVGNGLKQPKTVRQLQTGVDSSFTLNINFLLHMPIYNLFF